MYANLEKQLRSKGISINAAANAIKMPEATFRTKIKNRSFYTDEAFALKNCLFPEFDIMYLFQKDDDQKGA